MPDQSSRSQWVAATIATIAVLTAGFTVGRSNTETCNKKTNNLIELHDTMIAELKLSVRGLTLAQQLNAEQNSQVIGIIEDMKSDARQLVLMAEAIHRKIDEHEMNHERAQSQEGSY